MQRTASPLLGFGVSPNHHFLNGFDIISKRQYSRRLLDQRDMLDAENSSKKESKVFPTAFDGPGIEASPIAVRPRRQAV